MIGTGITGIPISVMNSLGYVYLDTTHRFAIDFEKQSILIQELKDDIWQYGSLITGAATLWLNLLGLSSIGDFLVTQKRVGDFHFFAHSHFDGQISTNQTQILDLYEFVERDIFQSDNSDVFTGSSFSFVATVTESVLSNKFYFQTDIIPANKPITISVWEGTIEERDNKIFKQIYPASEFPASTEIILMAFGRLKLIEGNSYLVKIESEADFSLKTNASISIPWMATDDSNFREDDILQVRSYDSRNDGIYSFTAGEDWSIYNKKIYICNTTGVQIGTFAENIALWDEFGAKILTIESSISIFFNHFCARFFGEKGLPNLQTWTHSTSGSATIDLVPDIVFGEQKNVVKLNDNVSNGLCSVSKTLTAADWLNIEAFGASYGGVSRLDTDNGTSVFSGLQVNQAEHPQGVGNRRYGLYLKKDGDFLKIEEVGNVTNNLTFDGVDDRPLILFDAWIKWETVIPPNFAAAVVYINDTEVLTISLRYNAGGLGTKAVIGSGSSVGVDLISYHENFGVTIYKESLDKLLSVEEMAIKKIIIIIPSGKRDYIITLPDDNPRGIGDGLYILANNLGGTITLKSEDPNAPQALFNGLNSISIDIIKNKEIRFINTVQCGNVYQAPEVSPRDFSRLNSYLPVATPYTTPVLSAGVPTKLLIPTTSKSIKDFSLDILNLRWFLDDITAINRWFIVHMVTSITTSASNHTVTLEMYKNGSLEEGMSIQRFISGGSDQGALAITGIAQLSNTDYIEIYVTDSTGGTVTFSHVAITINEMVGAIN